MTLIRQAHVSSSLVGLDFLSTHNFKPYRIRADKKVLGVDEIQDDWIARTSADETSIWQYSSADPLPMVQFGMYNDLDLQIFLHHPSLVVLVFQGMDALSIPEAIRARKGPTRYIAISKAISDKLTQFGIPHQVLPITATNPEKLFPVASNGLPSTYIRSSLKECIHFYSNDTSESGLEYYGYSLIEPLRSLGYKIIHTTLESYNRTEIIEVYKKCFINLRLTSFDGVPNVNLEMGLLGIPSVYNGEIPGSLHWSSLEDIARHINIAYVNRAEPSRLPDLIRNYLDIGEEWKSYGIPKTRYELKTPTLEP